MLLKLSLRDRDVRVIEEGDSMAQDDIHGEAGKRDFDVLSLDEDLC